jgi:hypothetical protein
LRVDDSGVFGTLSFNRTAFTCVVPWEAVFAVVGDDGRGMVWPASMPSEIAAEVDREVSRAKGGSGPEEGALDELPARRARNASRERELDGKSKHASATHSTGKKRPVVQPPSLELIAGEGGRPRSVRRRDGVSRPPHLRIVK